MDPDDGGSRPLCSDPVRELDPDDGGSRPLCSDPVRELDPDDGGSRPLCSELVLDDPSLLDRELLKESPPPSLDRSDCRFSESDLFWELFSTAKTMR